MTRDSFDRMANIINVAKTVKIESIVFEDGYVFGMDESRCVLLFNPNLTIDLPFKSIAITRVDAFISRLDASKSGDDLSIHYVLDESNTYVKSMLFKNKGLKIDYRCGDPSKIKTLRKINDDIMCKFNISDDDIKTIIRGCNAMNAANLTIIGNNSISYEMSDINGDIFKYESNRMMTYLTSDSSFKFANQYQVKLLLSMLKNKPNGTIAIGVNGSLHLEVDDVFLILLPRV